LVRALLAASFTVLLQERRFRVDAEGISFSCAGARAASFSSRFCARSSVSRVRFSFCASARSSAGLDFVACALSRPGAVSCSPPSIDSFSFADLRLRFWFPVPPRSVFRRFSVAPGNSCRESEAVFHSGLVRLRPDTAFSLLAQAQKIFFSRLVWLPPRISVLPPKDFSSPAHLRQRPSPARFLVFALFPIFVPLVLCCLRVDLFCKVISVRAERCCRIRPSFVPP
jgi:hypothetical protein